MIPQSCTLLDPSFALHKVHTLEFPAGLEAFESEVKDQINMIGLDYCRHFQTLPQPPNPNLVKVSQSQRASEPGTQAVLTRLISVNK